MNTISIKKILGAAFSLAFLAFSGASAQESPNSKNTGPAVDVSAVLPFLKIMRDYNVNAALPQSAFGSSDACSPSHPKNCCDLFKRSDVDGCRHTCGDLCSQAVPFCTGDSKEAEKLCNNASDHSGQCDGICDNITLFKCVDFCEKVQSACCH